VLKCRGSSLYRITALHSDPCGPDHIEPHGRHGKRNVVEPARKRLLAPLFVRSTTSGRRRPPAWPQFSMKPASSATARLRLRRRRGVYPLLYPEYHPIYTSNDAQAPYNHRVVKARTTVWRVICKTKPSQRNKPQSCEEAPSMSC
jgi:hypothetical protein